MPKELLLDSEIRSAPPAQPGKVYTMRDGRNLFVIVHDDGKRYFQFRYFFDGKQRLMQLGPHPRLSLAEAREQAEHLQKVLRSGADPRTARKLERVQKLRDTRGTFGVLAAQWLARNKSTWTERNYQRQSSLLRRILLPRLGDLPITQIDAVLVLDVLRAVEERGRLPTAREARTTASMIFQFGIASGLCLVDPARDLGRALLPRKAVQHHGALKLDEVGPLLRALSASGTEPVTASAIRLVLLLALRDFSLRNAKWEHVDLKNATWLIPAQNMKGRLNQKREFITPLPKQAVAVLKRLQPLTDRGPDSFVFAGHGKSGYMSATTITNAIQRLGFKSATCHGFRSLFTDWAYESGYRAEAIEAQLAHSWGQLSRRRGEDGNGKRSDHVRQAYLRSPFWEHRVAMLEHWGASVTALEKDKAPPKVRHHNILSIRAVG